MIWTLLFATYAVGLSVIFLILQKRRAKETDLLTEARKIAGGELTPLQRLEALAQMARIRKREMPWFEQSLSTLGVVVFFSMLIATSVQTAKASLEAAEAERLRQEVKALEIQRSDLDTLVVDITRAVVTQYRRTGRLDSTGERVLKHRLLELDKVANPSRADLIEKFEIAFIAGDFERAVSLIERNIDLLDRADPGNIITLAEYYYLDGAAGSAAELLAQLEPKMSTLPPAWRVRMIVLNSVLKPDPPRYSAELSTVLRISSEDAARQLELLVDRFKSASNQIKHMETRH